MAIIDRPRITEDYQLPERAPEQRRLKAPEVSLNADITAVLNHPDEAFVSFHPSEKTAIQEAIEQGLEEGRFQLTDEQRDAYAWNPPVTVKSGETIPYAQMMQDSLDSKLEGLRHEEKEQRVRLQHFREARSDLWKYATQRNMEPSQETLSNPAIYLHEVLKGLQPKYANRAVTRNNVQTGSTLQDFAMFSTEKPGVTANNAKLGTKYTPPKMSMWPSDDESKESASRSDIEVSLRYDEQSRLAGYRLTTDLNGKRDHQVSLILDPGASELRVVKHAHNDHIKHFEVTDDVKQAALIQATIANLYHRVSGHSHMNDEAAKAFTAITIGRRY